MLNKNDIYLGIAPIGWTNDDLPELGKENTFEQCVSEMALAGFQGSEIGSKYPKDPLILKEALDLRGIKICNCWFSTHLLTKPYVETKDAFIKQLDILKQLGALVIGVSEQSYSTQGKSAQPIFENKYVMNDEEWNLLIQGMNELGRIAEDKGMKLTYHHHMGTVVQTEDEITRFMGDTDPKYVNLLFDSGHLAYDGIDPVKILKKYIGRTAHVHLKDIRKNVLLQVKEEKLSFLEGVRKGTFTVPGDGDIDFEPLFQILDDGGYKGYIVVEAEQDPSLANPFLYAKKARKYIKEKTGI